MQGSLQLHTRWTVVNAELSGKGQYMVDTVEGDVIEAWSFSGKTSP